MTDRLNTPFDIETPRAARADDDSHKIARLEIENDGLKMERNLYGIALLAVLFWTIF